MNLNLWVAVFSLVFGLICILIEIWLVGRFAGKLRLSIIFLILATLVFVIEEILEILDLFAIANLRVIKNIALGGIILFIFLASLSMKQMINGIDGHHKKRRS